MDGIRDDNSVLPIPNHVVLNHLGTSAIKNGVLAVATTMRYHQKVLLHPSLHIPGTFIKTAFSTYQLYTSSLYPRKCSHDLYDLA